MPVLIILKSASGLRNERLKYLTGAGSANFMQTRTKTRLPDYVECSQNYPNISTVKRSHSYGEVHNVEP